MSDYLRTVPDLIRPWVPRRFFEVDRHHIALAALKALADDGTIEPSRVEEAIARYAIDAGGANPWDC